MRITLQFHPDWPFQGGLVIEAMARHRRYRSQFETGTSNGGLTAQDGGDRWRWESRLFKGRYDDRPATRRPLYGALNHRADPYGGSPRFGSCHFRLKPSSGVDATYCFPDSVFEPDAVTGVDGVDELITRADGSGLDYLDRYVEAHIHRRVTFASDVEAVVLDPCFVGTPVESAAESLGCPVEFHPGFRVRTGDLDPTFRGREFVELAQELGEVLTPDLVGRAARSGVHDQQSLKRVWHCLARFGRRTG